MLRMAVVVGLFTLAACGKAGTTGHDGTIEVTDSTDTMLDVTVPDPAPDETTDPEEEESGIWCACGGVYEEGSRVAALVDIETGIPSGTLGTALAGATHPFEGILVAWDEGGSSHYPDCDIAECGTCEPTYHGLLSQRWVHCDTIDLP